MQSLEGETARGQQSSPVEKKGVLSWEIENPGVPMPSDEKYDPLLLKEGDSRNVTDKYRYWREASIKEDLDKTRIPLHIAIENLTHDFNVGSIVRTANAFNVATIHIVGKRRYNQRGAMCTEKYQHVMFHPDTDDFVKWAEQRNITILGIDNVEGSSPIEEFTFPKECCLLFGTESDGLTQAARDASEQLLFITQLGSTRSMNAGAAASIAMYAHRVQQP
jgi:tRNA G18 (ribose-2'-O)-methylase SpoU